MKKHYHLIGIGGIGMSGIAHLLLSRKATVSGSDVKESRITEELKRLGARVFIGHHPQNISGVDTVIYSSAIKMDNPEIAEAKKKGLIVLQRAQALAELMKDKTVITVAGSHGKTTTASLVSYLLLQAGLLPTIAVGGILKNIDANAYLGEGEFFVAEADESDGSFLNYRPRYSVITNVDYEHLDYYKNIENELKAFNEFINRTDKDGCVFCCADDANLKNLLEDYKNRYVLFGLKKGADIYPRNVNFKGLSSEFDCFYKNKFLQRFYLNLGGEHNVSNSLAVIALGLELKLSPDIIKNTLANYKGAARRLEIKFSSDKLTVLDDYAHHPTEIKATLRATRHLGRKRVIAVFEPHRFSRTKLLLDEFSASFDSADCIVVTDIYPAGEPPLEGISGELLYNRMKERYPRKLVEFLPKAEIAQYVLKIIEPYDLVITMGAGDIYKVGDELVNGLKR